MPPRVKCLLVDDRAENLLALSGLLRGDDVELLEARSGPEALELLLVHDVALALLDVQMPGMDGFLLAELMRGTERTRHVPLIFVTAGAHDRHRVFKGYESGAVDFLHKPIEPHVLRNKAEVFFQLHRQKQQLARQLEERTETLRLHETFTAVLGHDLRNPLNAILMSAQVLERGTSDPAVRETAARMLAYSRRMGRIIEDTLDLARARLGGGIPIDRAPADLGEIVRRVVEEHEAASPGCRIDVQPEGDLGGAWDAGRLGQAIANLVGNALKHGNGGGVEVRLDGRRGDAVDFSVANPGGIPAEVLPHLFDPFRGGRRSEGLGLGLYIVQQIIAAHRGSIEVCTEERDRTLFRVSVPRGAPGRR